ncbi:MAG: hypothetical protein H6738_15480 [Alphaproteobacteria bacterium]|nr:hypothetical protein [Alphaproteobacteria bacterium]MCB9698179.1 hypothetical protein [Alphaproteobacteria bacterium]
MWVGWWLVAEARPRKPTQPPTTPVAPAPPAIGGDDGAAITLPPLAGPTEIPNLDGLARDTATFTLEVDLSALAELDEQQVDALFTLLAADPGWRVGRDESGARMAFLRADGQGVRGWTLGKDRCASFVVREAPDPRWEQGGNVVSTHAGADPIRARAYRPTGGTCSTFTTAVRVTGAVEVDVFEAGAVDARRFTLDGLDRLAQVVAVARPLAPTLVANGHDPLGEPPVPFPGPPVSSPGPGLLTMTGAVDPGKPAWVWARVLDPSGAPFAEPTLAAASLERPGWSPAGDGTFPVASTARVPPGPAFDGTLEWWAVADDGVPWLLGATSVTIPAR